MSQLVDDVYLSHRPAGGVQQLANFSSYTAQWMQYLKTIGGPFDPSGVRSGQILSHEYSSRKGIVRVEQGPQAQLRPKL
uniref:Uncharacterized protein n=1 Tax=Pristionchus pacificus TaxID=54126 RepID=A0A2A6B2X2_PRIPA|eukprot:PDM60211.1 hypothetical protein PRIPAC_54036 [Pristionchus pacificus]